jgi:hypothetical protein
MLNIVTDIKVNPADSTISGSNTIKYQVLDEYQMMQIDLLKSNADSKSSTRRQTQNMREKGMLFHFIVSPTNQVL